MMSHMMTFIGSLRAVKFCLQTRSKEPLGSIMKVIYDDDDDVYYSTGIDLW